MAESALPQDVPSLSDLLRVQAARAPGRIAIEVPPAATITYGGLDVLADAVAARLADLGVRGGDRVGIVLPKSIDAVVAQFGAMRAGAAYVPVAADGPAWRTARILNDCAVAAVVVADALREPLVEALAALGASPAVIGTGVNGLLAEPPRGTPAPLAHPPRLDDRAYILYTSGSTGHPKGVVHTHRNALAFVRWCAGTFAPRPEDRFSSHAPFHFDLSVFDLYVPLAVGGTVVLVPEDVAREPQRLAALMDERALTIWYSAPSVLALLARYGKLDRHPCPRLRLVLFAGEVFPVKHLRALQRLLPAPRYYNLYGPTETNVCTFHEIPAGIPDDRTAPYPIGQVCANYRGRVVGPGGADVPPGDEGELCIAGPGVMTGYWNRPDLTAAATLVDGSGTAWYRTGDFVCAAADGTLTFVGRRDRMIKRRGHRIELAEVEAALYRHPDVREAAVIAAGGGAGLEESLRAFLSFHGAPPSVLVLRKFCAAEMPSAMVPDTFTICDRLPRTSTDKVDYQRLAGMA